MDTKEYREPSLTIHGSVEDLTQNSGWTAKDTSEGDNNTAYS